jgi:carbon storage regulator
MLVLSRKSGQKVHIGAEITFTVLGVSGNRVRIGIEAPARILIFRGELGEPLGRDREDQWQEIRQPTAT